MTDGINSGVTKMIGDAIRKEKERRQLLAANFSQQFVTSDRLENLPRITAVGIVPTSKLSYAQVFNTEVCTCTIIQLFVWFIRHLSKETSTIVWFNFIPLFSSWVNILLFLVITCMVKPVIGIYEWEICFNVCYNELLVSMNEKYVFNVWYNQLLVSINEKYAFNVMSMV